MTDTIRDLDAKADAAFKDAADSFDRCDTDGFVSQWASGLTGRMYRAKADLVRNGGTATFLAVFDLDGNYVPAKAIDGKWGKRWMILDASGRATGTFLPYRPKRRDTLAKRGYTLGTVVRPADAVIAAPAGARGLSGATLCYIDIVPTDRPTDTPLSVIDPDIYS